MRYLHRYMILLSTIATFLVLLEEELYAETECVGVQSPTSDQSDTASCTDEQSLSLRKKAVLALGQIGGSAIPLLQRKLLHTERLERIWTLQALSNTKPQSKISSEKIAKFLSSDDAEERRLAVRTLAKTGKNALPFLTQFRQFTNFGDPRIRIASLEAIGNIGPNAREASPELFSALRSSNLLVRREAVEAIAKIQPQVDKSAPALVTALRDNDAWTAQSASRALASYKTDAFPFLVQSIQSSNDREKQLALATFERIKAYPQAIQNNLLLLSMEKDSTIRESSLRLIGFGHPNYQVVSVLADALKDPDLVIRQAGHEAIQRLDSSILPFASDYVESKQENEESLVNVMRMLGNCGQQAIPLLNQRLSDNREVVFRTALMSIAKIVHHKPKSAQVALQKIKQHALKNKKFDSLWQKLPELPSSRLSALIEAQARSNDPNLLHIQMIGYLGENVGEEIHVLWRFLTTGNIQQRVAAAKALSSYPTAVSTALPQLIRMLRDRNIDLRKAVINALIVADSDTVTDILIQQLDSRDIRLVTSATIALGKIGLAADKAVSKLLLLLKRDELNVRLQAIRALGQIHTNADTVIPELICMLKSSEEIESRFTVEALVKYGAASANQLGDVITSDAAIANYAAEALVLLGSSARPALDSLVNVLKKTKSPYLRRSIVIALSKIGKPAVPHMIQIVADDNVSYELKAQAIEILSRIGSQADAAIPILAKVACIKVAIRDETLSSNPDRNVIRRPTNSHLDSFDRLSLDASPPESMVIGRVNLNAWPSRKVAALSFSFDDGCKSGYKWAAPDLEQRGWRGTYYLNKYAICEKRPWTNLAIYGHEIGNHTCSHPIGLPNLCELRIQEELTSCNSFFQAGIATNTTTSFAYPYTEAGPKDGRLRKHVRRLFVCARGGPFAPFASSDPLDMDLIPSFNIETETEIGAFNERMARAISSGGWLVLMYHAVIDDDGYKYVTMANWKAQLDLVESRSDQLWVAPVSKIARYILQRRAAKVTSQFQGSNKIEISVRCNGIPGPLMSMSIDVRVPNNWKEVEIAGHRDSVLVQNNIVNLNVEPNGQVVQIINLTK